MFAVEQDNIFKTTKKHLIANANTFLAIPFQSCYFPLLNNGQKKKKAEKKMFQ